MGVPNVREEYEKSIDNYCLAHLINHECVGLRNQAEEANLATLLRKYTCDRDLAAQNQTICQQSFDNIFAEILIPIVSMPREKALCI